MRFNFLYIYLHITFLTSRAVHVPQQNVLENEHEPNAPQPTPREDELDHYIKWLLKGYNIPGLSLAIVDDDHIATKGYGYARLPSTPATPDTLWFTGSTTKAFVAAAAGILMEDKQRYPSLTWTSRIQDHLPAEFALQDDYIGKHLTMEDALCHRSGLPRHDKAYGWGNNTLLDTVKLMRYLPLNAEFRTILQYNNLMFSLVSATLERITGELVVNLIRRLIWNPVGMRSSFFFPQEFAKINQTDVRNRLARGYYWVDELQAGKRGPHYVPEPYMDLTTISGAGATVSSVRDYALWMKTMLRSDALNPILERNQTSPISAQLYQELVKPRTMNYGEGFVGLVHNDYRRPEGYGLAWMTASYTSYPIVGHTGSLNGFWTSLWMIPNLNIGVVIMTNVQDGNVVASLIADAIFKAKVQNGKAHLRARENLPSPRRNYSTAISMFRSQPHNTAEAFTSFSSQAAKPFIGIYRHPGYGTLSITLAQETAPERYLHEYPTNITRSKHEVPDLHITPSKRTWAFDYYVKHDSGSWFQATEWTPHGMHTEDAVPGLERGCDGSMCEDEVIMVRKGNPRFINFEYDPHPIGDESRFQKAARFGMHLTDEMLDVAEGHGKPGTWKEGVIWFDRVE